MNLTELARILKITPQELRDTLPQIGFDIGQRAIKIDNRTAQKIIKTWHNLIKQLEAQKKKIADNQSLNADEETKEQNKKIFVSKFITVRDFSAISQIPVNIVLAELMKNGIFVSMNEKIDFDTAEIIGHDLNLEVKFKEKSDELNEEINSSENKLVKILEQENKNQMVSVSPVVVIMGHVDHGKTQLLDAIRNTNVVKGEAGGITQHIGAYQKKRKNKLITFIDTPGHEAFTAMRSRGAKVADIAVLVVAADDGVKPQTIEAFRIIKSAKIPFLIAINKIDKAGADINKTKQELSSQLNISPEDWGGKDVCVLVSAIQKTGITDLLDIILLIADMEAENIKANPNSAAVGTVIESHIDKGAGPIVTILVQNGTLNIGDQLCYDNKIYGKVRSMKNYQDENIQKATPSTPVKILGLKILPKIGDILEAGDGKRIKKKIYSSMQNVDNKFITKQQVDSQSSKNKEENNKIKNLYVIIKSDTLGSAEAIEESLEKINTEELRVKIIHKGLGNITEGDISRADNSNAQIIGFNVKIPPQINDLIRNQCVQINIFNIIYDLIKHTKIELQKLIKPTIQRVDVGKLKVLQIFRTEKDCQIIGAKVLDGKAEIENSIEIIRNKYIEGCGKLIKLQSGKQDVKFVEKNQECGIKYEGKPIIQKDDILLCYKSVISNR